MTTKAEKHTPLPWVIDSEWAHTITTPGGMTIAKAESNREEWQANAEYIVRACNSYPDLLDACKAVLAFGKGLALTGLGDERAHGPVLLSKLQAVITRAEKG